MAWDEITETESQKAFELSHVETPSIDQIYKQSIRDTENWNPDATRVRVNLSPMFVRHQREPIDMQHIAHCIVAFHFKD